MKHKTKTKSEHVLTKQTVSRHDVQWHTHERHYNLREYMNSLEYDVVVLTR